MQARLKPCIKRENVNHRACTNEGCSLFLYRAQPVSEMERGARNRAARRKISANYLTVYLLYTLTCVYEKIGTRVSEKNIRWEVPA